MLFVHQADAIRLEVETAVLLQAGARLGEPVTAAAERSGGQDQADLMSKTTGVAAGPRLTSPQMCALIGSRSVPPPHHHSFSDIYLFICDRHPVRRCADAVASPHPSGQLRCRWKLPGIPFMWRQE